jgi:hypothetical protein
MFMRVAVEQVRTGTAWTAWTAWNRTGVFTRAVVEFLILKTGTTSMTRPRVHEDETMEHGCEKPDVHEKTLMEHWHEKPRVHEKMMEHWCERPDVHKKMLMACRAAGHGQQ